jgi:hypothetical protein
MTTTYKKSVARYKNQASEFTGWRKKLKYKDTYNDIIGENFSCPCNDIDTKVQEAF